MTPDEFTFFTEKDTSFIYEVRFFGDFVLVRPASTMFYSAVRQVPLGEFMDAFEEYSGDPAPIIKYLTEGLSGEEQTVLLQ